MADLLTRRGFLRKAAAVSAGAFFASGDSARRSVAGASLDLLQAPFDLAVVKGDSPARNCIAALDALGGLSRFVREGAKVAIKPNPIGTSRPERAIHTNPAMIEAVIRECFRVGAREVVVLSNDDLRSMELNGTADAVAAAGGTLKSVTAKSDFREVLVPRGRILRRIELAADIVEADCFINMPIAKHHAGTQVTLSLKNMMGSIWDRMVFHQTDLHECIAELGSAVYHDLVIMDANHVLRTNGPAGPGQVSRERSVIAGADPVAVDSFASRFFQLEGGQVRHIRAAYDLGVGEIDLAKVRVKELEI